MKHSLLKTISPFRFVHTHGWRKRNHFDFFNLVDLCRTMVAKKRYHFDFCDFFDLWRPIVAKKRSHFDFFLLFRLVPTHGGPKT